MTKADKDISEPLPDMLAMPDTAYQPRKKRFLTFNSSPLARKIIAFNLIALGILVTGILYLNQSNEGRVSQRRLDMMQQVEILAAAFAAQQDLPKEFFTNLALPLEAIVRLYDAEGNLIWQQLPEIIATSDSMIVPQQTSFLTDMMQGIWQSLRAENTGNNTDILLERFDELVAAALNMPDQTQQLTYTSSGDLYVTVAAPVIKDGQSVQVVLISTIGGEIDAVIRAEREQILQVFVLAILSSIVLSIVLANSIARPLRRLADAADTAHANAGTRLNPANIHIPDLTARPDEIGDLSRAMRKMIEALFDRIDENKNFAADVAHEIKNPLTSLRSAVATLAYPLEEAERSALLDVIRADVVRLDRLVTDISNASRLEGELVRDVWAKVDLSNLLKNHVEHYGAEHPDISVSLESGNENFQVTGLEGRLSQVFDNLITNALGFVPKSGWIKISLDHDGPEMIEIRVTDNGPGIPADNLDDVFERFYSERPAAEFGEHSGLGLAISKQIVEVHNGTISVRNVAPGGGAQFIIRLPV